MSKQPWMPLFCDAFIADTLHLSAAEVGAYCLLLMAMWRNNGTVPDDDKDLARITRSGKRWRSVKERLRPMLTFADGRVTQKRLLKEWDYVSNLRKKNAENARARWNKNSELADATASVSHMPNRYPHTHTHTHKEKKKEGAKAPPAFQGKIIGLSQTDFDLWKQSFPFVDLRPYLVSRDEFLAGLADDDDRRRRWMISTSADLRNKNEAARAKRKPPTVGLKFKDQGPEPVKPPAEERERQVAAMLARGSRAQREAAE